MSAPLNKVEKIVHDALMARGMTTNEAKVVISKLKNASSFKGQADIELSNDGRFVALSPVICLAVSPKSGALLCEWRGQPYWFPKGQVDDSSEVKKKDDTGILIISRWIAEKKGLVDKDGTILSTP